MKKSKIYFDHSATTPVDPEVLTAMLPYLKENFGNASSVHSFGQEAMKGVDRAREILANFLGAKPKEIIFTSGATESDNLAIKGVVKKILKNHKLKTAHIVTSAIEHPAVLEPFQEMANDGIKIARLPVTSKGLVKIEDVRSAITDETILISIMYVNNEVGTIQPVAEVGKLVKEVRAKRQKNGNKLPIIFHTDAVQAVNYCNCRVDDLGVDLMSISGHKIYGPKGVGVIYIREKTPLEPVITGGHQEYGLRSGTYNTAGIVGLARAVEIVSEKREEEEKRLKILRDKLIKNVLEIIPDARVNGDLEQRIPSNANFCFKNAEGESVLLMLDLAGIAVSTGSACASGSLSPSHVLLAMGIPEEVAHGSLRVTLGRYTTEKEINKFLEILPPIIKKLREISPVK